jgi:hypothetical protein
MEELVVDKRLGLFINHDLAGYEVPVHADIPYQEVVFLDTLDPVISPMKAKGVGELGICGVGAAIANAIYNATGVRVRNYPITLDKLLPGLPDGLTLRMDRPVASPMEASAAGGGSRRSCRGPVRSAGLPRRRQPARRARDGLDARARGEHAVLALVLETDGSTYAGAGDMVLFCNGSQVGWLSGGCLERARATRGAGERGRAGRLDRDRHPQ